MDKVEDFRRNPGTEFDLAPVESVAINRSAIERRADGLSGRRSVKRECQAGWLLAASPRP
jgi:deoxyribose-phosphate aldolase